jgi:hypothetical protein
MYPNDTDPGARCAHGFPVPTRPLPRGHGVANPPVLVCCARCGKPEWRKASYAARGGTVYCSVACKAAGTSTVAERACAHCGTRFKPTAQQVKLGRGQTCSYTCRGLAQRNLEPVRCAGCRMPMPERSGLRARNLGIEPMCRVCANQARAVDPKTRFETRRGITGPDGCRDWLGIKDDDGYGVFAVTHDYKVAASRYAYCLAANIDIMSLTDEDHVCHTCDNPGCVQTDGITTYFVVGVPYTAYGHLFLADNETNMLDMRQKRMKQP